MINAPLCGEYHTWEGKCMKLYYSDLAALISFLQDKADEEKYNSSTVDELIKYLDEKPDGFIKLIINEDYEGDERE